jgi:ArsR family transcriptional regulator
MEDSQTSPPDANRLLHPAVDCCEIAEFFKLLSSENRLRILFLLLTCDMTVSDLVLFLRIPQSTVSSELGLLRRAKVVSAQKMGRQVLYSISDQRIGVVLKLWA